MPEEIKSFVRIRRGLDAVIEVPIGTCVYVDEDVYECVEETNEDKNDCKLCGLNGVKNACLAGRVLLCDASKRRDKKSARFDKRNINERCEERVDVNAMESAYNVRRQWNQRTKEEKEENE